MNPNSYTNNLINVNTRTNKSEVMLSKKLAWYAVPCNYSISSQTGTSEMKNEILHLKNTLILKV